MFDHGLDLEARADPLGFRYGPDCFGPEPEVRHLDAIRPSLRDPGCEGPDNVYAIAMDVGRPADRPGLLERNLLYGAVAYAAGRLGDEPVRSQGHIHADSPKHGWSTPELYEIWAGRAVILMQERCVAGDADPGRCFAVSAGPGEVVVVPPAWAHATLSADPTQPLVFGAWCDRDYGFVYGGVRAHGGLAWFPRLDDAEALHWSANESYKASPLLRKEPRPYPDLNVEPDRSIYRQHQADPDRFLWVTDPARAAEVWEGFEP